MRIHNRIVCCLFFKILYFLNKRNLILMILKIFFQIHQCWKIYFLKPKVWLIFLATIVLYRGSWQMETWYIAYIITVKIQTLIYLPVFLKCLHPHLRPNEMYTKLEIFQFATVKNSKLLSMNRLLSSTKIKNYVGHYNCKLHHFYWQ